MADKPSAESRGVTILDEYVRWAGHSGFDCAQ